MNEPMVAPGAGRAGRPRRIRPAMRPQPTTSTARPGFRVRRPLGTPAFVSALVLLSVPVRELPPVAALAGPAGAAAQETIPRRSDLRGLTEVVERCAAGSPDLDSPCREMGLAAMSLQQGVGLAGALGSDLPGSPSTLGRRLGSMPRLGLTVSGGLLGVRVPPVAAATAEGLEGRETLTLAGLRVDAAAGVFDGFRMAPTLGGVLAVDLIGSYSRVRLPEGAGVTGSSAGMGLGARVGLLRESFTVPGISVSATRRWHGSIRAGSIDSGTAAQADAELTVSSLRAVMGKNWFVVGIMGGAGWDRYSGDTRLSVPRGTADLGSVTGHVASERMIYFLSGWFNFVITQASAEVGVADGVPDPFAERAGTYDPSGLTWYLSAAFRITL